MRHNRDWTAEQEDRLRKLLDGEHSLMAIADSLSRTLGSVLAKISDLGLTPPRNKINQIRRKIPARQIRNARVNTEQSPSKLAPIISREEP